MCRIERDARRLTAHMRVDEIGGNQVLIRKSSRIAQRQRRIEHRTADRPPDIHHAEPMLEQLLGTAVPALFVAGDNAAREHVAGAISGGGNVNSAWALSSGLLAGRAATERSLRLRAPSGHPVTLGCAGLRPSGSARPIDLAPVQAAMRREMQVFDRALFRTAAGLEASRQTLDAAWDEIAAHAQGDDLKTREAAALLATARWSVASALARQESRGMHLRVDATEARDELSHRLLSGGLDDVWTRWDKPVRRHQPAAMEAVS
jgi:succinate dehydrogenase/fumarate reductase flavoprotein subunit